MSAIAIPLPPVVRVSRILGTRGNAVLSGGSSTYGTDYTAALQALIDNYQGWQIVWDGQYSHTGLTIPSYTSIHFLPGCGSILRPASNAQLYRNAHLSTGVGGSRGNGAGQDTPTTLGNITDTSIRLVGGIHNCNVTQQTTTAQSSLLHGTQFWGVTDFYCDDMTFIDGSLWFANAQYFGGRRVTSINHSGPSAGPQINGPCQFFVFDECRCINSFDDNFAINADDGSGYEIGGVIVSYPLPGAITDGIVRNLTCTGGMQGLRFLSCTQRIDRIVVDGLVGNTSGEWAIISNFGNYTGTIGAGNIGSITISNVDVTITGLNPHGGGAWGETSTSDVYLSAVFESIAINGWKKNNPTAFQPALFHSNFFGAPTSGSLKVTGFEYRESNASHSGPAFLLDGNLNVFQISDSTLVREDAIGLGDSPLVKVDPLGVTGGGGTSATGPQTVIVRDVYTRNCQSVAEIASGTIGELLKVSGQHLYAGGNAAVTVGSGATVKNLDTTQLASMPVAGAKWSGAGSVTHNIDAGASYTE